MLSGLGLTKPEAIEQNTVKNLHNMDTN